MFITNLWGLGFVWFCTSVFCLIGGIMLGAEKQREFLRKEGK